MSVLATDRPVIGALRPFVGRPGTAERAFMVLAFMVLIAARLPNVALHGRVWAEEGTFFLRNAALLPWTQALFHPVGGYLNLVANVAGLVGIHLVPLEQVRFVGVATGLLFQTLPAVLIVFSGVYWLQSRISLVAALLLLATVPIAEEVWLNSLHPQFHLTLCAALILAMPPARSWIRWFHGLLILLGALCGPTTWFLLPLFLARAVIDGSGPRAVQATILGVGILIQVLFFYQSAGVNGASVSLSGVSAMLLSKNVLIPWLDYRSAGAMTDGLAKLVAAGTVPVGLVLGEVAVNGLVGGLLWRRDRDAAFWMFAAALFVAIPSYAAARGGSLNSVRLGISNRYAFVPQVLLALVVLWGAAVGKDWIAIFARAGVVWLLVIGTVEFRDDPVHKYFDRGPSWVEQVAAWRKDHTHLLRIWPSGWTVDLNVPALKDR